MDGIFINTGGFVNCSLAENAGHSIPIIPESGVFCHATAYGYILAKSSDIIADGSELLLAVMDPGLIGGLLLPVMGAVPDAAIVLFSGLGPNAQEELKVGVGTLAVRAPIVGSTIMLLTIPWSLCVFAGRVDLVKDVTGKTQAAYRRKASKRLTNKSCSLSKTGVQPDTSVIRPNALIMMATALAYLVIQGPSFAFEGDKNVAKEEHNWALAGLILSSVSFVMYSLYQVFSQSALDEQRARKDLRIRQLARAGGISIEALLSDSALAGNRPAGEAGAALQETLHAGRAAELNEQDRKSLHVFVQALFQHVQSLVLDDGYVDAREARIMIHTLLPRDPTGSVAIDIDGMIREYGDLVDGKYKLNEQQFEEVRRLGLFMDWFVEHGKKLYPSRRCCSCAEIGDAICSLFGSCGLRGGSSHGISLARGAPASTLNRYSPPEAGDSFLRQMESTASSASVEPILDGEAVNVDDGNDADGDEELEEEGADEDEPDTHGMSRGAIYAKALFMMAFGVGVVTVFSDPMVGVLSTFGKRIGVNPFYVSFLVTPLVSNASEFISSLLFAGKKTKKSITMTFSTLIGAACMNNTLGLAIFLALVYFQKLVWEFSAEVMAILVIEVIVGLVALYRIQPLRHGLLILFLFPASIALVAILENVAGWN